MSKQTSSGCTQGGAAIYSDRVLKLYDWWVLGLSNSHAWKCPTDVVLMPLFQEHLSANHLDVGVGSGFYLANSPNSPGQHITLFDLNENSLRAAATRIARSSPALIHGDIIQPGDALAGRKFDSISLFYLLHCLPGRMEEKAPLVFATLANHLSTTGVLYGATILGDEVNHNWLGRRLMKLYNRKGIFGNADDTLASLQAALTGRFSKVAVWRHGKVALFRAETPLY